MTTQPLRILTISDSPARQSWLVQLGRSMGWHVSTASGEKSTADVLSSRSVDLVIAEAASVEAGAEVRRVVHSIDPRCRIVLLGDESEPGSVSEGGLEGPGGWMAVSPTERRLREVLTLVRQALASDPRGPGAEAFEGIVGRSQVMLDLFTLIRRLAPHARTTLVTGETGTGKELVARALHARGPRHARRLVTVNCSAVVESLFESELFGHVRGAFTGAVDHKPGLIELAHGGTLFLDEVGELPAGAQAKLLRVLENGEVQRVGSLEARLVDVHVIAATNRNLEAEAAAGRFRRDLLYRLNVLHVHVPPLRERRDDISDLARFFVAGCAQRLGKSLTGLSSRAERVLAGGEWSGNVRELRNVLERACILAEGEVVDEGDFGCEVRVHRSNEEPRKVLAGPVPLAPHGFLRLDEVERGHIVRTLAEAHGNKAVAARRLGVSRRALYRHLERHGLHRRTLGDTTLVPEQQLDRAS